MRAKQTGPMFPRSDCRVTSSHSHSFGGRLMWRLERAEHSGDEFREALPLLPLSLSWVTGKRGPPTKGGSCGTSESASVRTQPRRMGSHWGRQGRGAGGTARHCDRSWGSGSSWESSQACGVRVGGDWSAEPSDEPGAECGLQTASMNSIRVRKADLLSVGPSGEREQ